MSATSHQRNLASGKRSGTGGHRLLGALLLPVAIATAPFAAPHSVGWHQPACPAEGVGSAYCSIHCNREGTVKVQVRILDDRSVMRDPWIHGWASCGDSGSCAASDWSCSASFGAGAGRSGSCAVEGWVTNGNTGNRQEAHVYVTCGYIDDPPPPLESCPDDEEPPVLPEGIRSRFCPPDVHPD